MANDVEVTREGIKKTLTLTDGEYSVFMILEKILAEIKRRPIK